MGHRRQGRPAQQAAHAHHQRADGRRPGLRSRQEEEREGRRFRPRRRHVRHLDSRRRRRRLPGRGRQRRHAPGRRRFRSGADRLHRRGVQERERHRPAQGPDGIAAAEGGRRAGQEGPVAAGDDRHQPAVHHGGRFGSEAPATVADAIEVRAAGGPAGRALPRPGDEGAGRRQHEAGRHRRGGAGRRHDAHAEDPVAGEGHFRQGRPQGRQPRRGRRRRRGHPRGAAAAGQPSRRCCWWT